MKTARNRPPAAPVGRAAAARVGPPRRTRPRFAVLADRVLSVGIVSDDPQVQRRQRFVNTGAILGTLASLQHAVEQALTNIAALQPLMLHNIVFGCLYLVTPVFHRVSAHAAALWLCAIIIVGTLRVIWMTGLAGGAQVYFAFTAAAFLFFGVAHWRMFAAVVAAAFTAVVGSLALAPKAGPIALAAPQYVEHLSAMVVVNVMVINVWLFTYALTRAHRAETQLAAEVTRADNLLLAILPQPIAARLKDAPGRVVADSHGEVTILFADVVGFTAAARRASPQDLVAWLDTLFKRIDALAAEHKVEKIKTIGDAYMAVSGLRVPPAEGAQRVARFALALREFAQSYGKIDGGQLDVRIGIHTGPVVAGVIGGSRFAYDLWGDSVNTASRMESHSAPGRIQVTAATAILLGPAFRLTSPCEVTVKGIGPVSACYLEGEVVPQSPHVATIAAAPEG